MQPIHLAISEPFAAPPSGASWVVFGDSHSYAAEADAPSMLSRAIRYARKHGVYLIPGKFLRDGRICLCIISPEGEPVLGQEALFLNLSHRGELARGDTPAVADTPFGRVALCVDVDINHPEYIKALAGLGAQVVFSTRYLELFDAVENRIKGPVISAALSGGLYVVSVTNAGCCIAGPDGRLILSVRDSLAMTATIEAAELTTDPRRIATGRRLIDRYFAEKEGADHA